MDRETKSWNSKWWTTTPPALCKKFCELRSTMDVIFRLHGRKSKPIWLYFPSAMVRQKVKLHEHYFPSMYIKKAHTWILWAHIIGLWSHWYINYSEICRYDVHY